MTEMEANGIESPEMSLQIHGQVIKATVSQVSDFVRTFSDNGHPAQIIFMLLFVFKDFPMLFISKERRDGQTGRGEGLHFR